MMGLKARMRSVFAALAFTLLVLAVWQLLVTFGLVNRIFVAGPIDAAAVIIRRFGNGELLSSIGTTTWRMLAGWLLACAIGIPLGAIIGTSKLAHRLLTPTLEAFRPLPASAIIPVAILILGLSDKMAVAVIAFGSLWPILLSTIHGFRTISREMREVGDILEMSGTRYFFIIALPAASVDILAGMRISLALSLILAIVTEMQASLTGLGYDIFIAQRMFRSPDIYAGLIVIGLIGLCINQVLITFENRFMKWARASGS